MMSSKKTYIAGMATLPLALFGLCAAFASSVATPNTFVSGTTAVAAEVNANFAAHAAAINDNDARIDNAAHLEQGLATSPSVTVSDGDTSVHDLGSVTINAPTAGSVLVLMHVRATFAGDSKALQFELTDGASSLAGALMGRTQGVGTDAFVDSTMVSAVVPVVAGSHTFDATVQGIVGIDTGDATFIVARLQALFISNP